jgi:hypothetical protein
MSRVCQKCMCFPRSTPSYERTAFFRPPAKYTSKSTDGRDASSATFAACSALHRSLRENRHHGSWKTGHSNQNPVINGAITGRAAERQRSLAGPGQDREIREGSGSFSNSLVCYWTDRAGYWHDNQASGPFAAGRRCRRSRLNPRRGDSIPPAICLATSPSPYSFCDLRS